MNSSTGGRPLSIVQVSTWEVAGGAEKTALALHHFYRQMGHKSTLVVKGKISDDPDVLVVDNSAREKTFYGRVLSLLERKLGLEAFYYPGSHRIPKLVGGPWDILHLHNPHGGYFDLAALPALSRLAPTVLTMHDNWAMTGHCAYHVDCGCWQTGCGRCPDLLRYPKVRRDATRFNLRRKRKNIGGSRLWLTAPSQWMLDEAKKTYLADKPMRVVPVSVELDIFTPGSKAEARARLELPADRPIVLFSANGGLLSNFKDGATLLKALPQVAARIPNVLPVVLGGAGIPRGFEQLGRQILARPHENDRRKVADYFRAADVLAHATKAESAGMVLVEAMACGLPVVATRVGGIPEYIKDGQSGLLVPPGDSEALARQLGRVLLDRPAARELAEHGKQAAAQFSLEAQAGRYLDLYREIAIEAPSAR